MDLFNFAYIYQYTLSQRLQLFSTNKQKKQRKKICDSCNWLQSAVQQNQAFKGIGTDCKKAMDGRKALENTLAP